MEMRAGRERANLNYFKCLFEYVLGCRFSDLEEISLLRATKKETDVHFSLIYKSRFRQFRDGMVIDLQPSQVCAASSSLFWHPYLASGGLFRVLKWSSSDLLHLPNSRMDSS